MGKFRWGYIFILLWLLVIPLAAQDDDARSVAYGQIVGDIFISANDAPQEWYFQAEANDIVVIQVQRIGGVFIPRISLLAPDGSTIEPTSDVQDDFAQTLTFQDGLAVAGEYRILVSQSNASSDGILTQSEYSLQVNQRGQVPSVSELQSTIPDFLLETRADYFVGAADTESFPDIEIYGDATIEAINNATQVNRVIFTGTRTVSVDNNTVISRLIDRLAFSSEGVALQTNTGAVVFSDLNISNLRLDSAVLTIELENETIISTDFYAIDSIMAIGDLVGVRLLDGQVLVFDSKRINLTRRGGTSGEGPNAEPVLLIQVDGAVLQTDASGWNSLSVLNNTLQVIYATGWRFNSDVLNTSLLQRGNSIRPDLDPEGTDTNFFDLRVDYAAEQNLTLAIEPDGLGSILVRSDAMSVSFLDSRQLVDELGNLRRVLVANQIVRLEKTNNTATTVLPDNTRIATPATISRDVRALPADTSFRPQNFNNLGSTVTDYHPRVDMSFALEPVNRVIGNFVYPVQDYSVPSSALALDWSRTYNSMASATQTPQYMLSGISFLATIGNQWRHSYQYELDVRLAPLGSVQLTLADGSSHIFTATNPENTVFRSTSLLSWTIARPNNFASDWTAYSSDDIQYHFDAAGRLQGITNSYGHVLHFSSIPDHYLADMGAQGGFFITESYGRRLEVYTDAERRVIAVRGVQGRIIRYHYEDDKLIEVDYLGADYRASYVYSDGLLSEIDDVNSPYAQNIAIEYNAIGRVTAYTYYPDTALPERYNLDYAPNRTVQTWEISDADDNRLALQSIWTYDEGYRLTSWTMPDLVPDTASDTDWVYQWRYVQDTGILSEIVQPTLAVLRFNYDEFGYLTRFTDPLFGSGTGSYVFSYQSGSNFMRLLTQIDTPNISAWVTLGYDEQNRLSTVNQAVSGIGAERQIYLTRYEYNARSELRRILEPSPSGGEVETHFVYDSFGYPVLIRIGTPTQIELNEPVKRWQMLHDGEGRLLSVLDERGITSTIHWNNDRNLIEEIAVGEEVLSYAYDAQDNLISYRSPQIRENYGYNAANQLVWSQDVLSRVTEYEYDSVGNLIMMIMPDDRTLRYTYDALNHLSSETNVDGFRVDYRVTLNQASNRIEYSISNPLGEQIQYQYDTLGRLRQVTDFDRNAVLTFRYNLNYNARGNLTEVLDSRGRSLTIDYDMLGNPIATTLDGTARTTYTYNSARLLQTVTNPLGASLSYEYDILGHPISVRLPNDTQQLYEYDSVGNLLRFVDAAGGEYSYRYDDANRLISETNPEQDVTAYEYDSAGNLAVVVDARGDGIRTEYHYDEANRLIEWIDRVGGVTQYTYDELGNIVRITEPTGLQTDLTYDESNNIVALTQPDDREFLFGRDSLGRVISETNPLGQTTVYSYNVIGQIGRITNPLGTVQSYSWYGNGRIARYAVSDGIQYEYITDDIGRLTDIVDLGTEQTSAVNTRFVYDILGQITEIRQGNQTVLAGDTATRHIFDYDALGRVSRYTPPNSTIPYSFNYDALGNIVRVFNPNGVETQYEYDALGNVIVVRSAIRTDNELEETYSYDAVGNVSTSRTADGIFREYTYDSANRLTEMSETALDDTTRTFSFTYDAAGRVSRYFDPEGRETIYRYDLFGNLVAIEQTRSIDGEQVILTTRYGYDAVDNMVRVQLPGAQTITMTYNGAGQRVRYVDAANNTWSYSYDESGNVSQVSNPLGYNQVFEFDVANRLSQIIYEQGATVDFAYDGRGNLTRVLLPTIENTPIREQVNYGLDASGALTSITHGGDNVYTLERDRLGRVSLINTPSDGGIALAYDESSRIISVAARAYRVDREYDSAGRMIEISNVEEAFRFEYDAYGRIASMTSSDVSATDDSETVTTTVAYDYDLVGNIVSRNAGEFGEMHYEYDAFDRPIHIAFNDGEWVDITYNENGWRNTISRSNGVETRYTYDQNGRVRNVVHINTANNQRLDGFAYEYDAVGNIIRVTRSDNWAILYSYDAARQLISERWLDEANQIVFSVNYVYDDAGNRIEQTQRVERENQVRTIFDYNNRNQLISETQGADINIEDRFSFPVTIALVFGLPFFLFVRRRPRWIPVTLILIMIVIAAWQTAPRPSVEYIYDENGNLVQEIYSETNQTNYEYDDFNRLVSVSRMTDEGESVTRIKYNTMGRVAEVDENGYIYEFIYDAFGLIAVRDPSSTQVYFSPIPDDTMLITSEGSDYWTIDDGLGRVRRFANADGASVNATIGFHRNAFGEIIIPYQEFTDPDIPQRDLVEQIYLADANVVLMGVRAYHPRIGRFLQRDWVRHDPRGNLYTYVYNSPTNFTDPSGLTPEAAYDGINPELAVIDPMDFVMQASAPPMPNIANVAALQGQENHRILELAYAAQYQINDATLSLARTGCDVFLHTINPIDALQLTALSESRGDMLSMYTMDSAWLPASRPQVANSVSALNQVDGLNALLSRSLQGASSMQACAQALRLPDLPNPELTSFYDNLLAMRGLLNEVPLYSGLVEQVPNLMNTMTPDTISPQIIRQDINPVIMPILSGQVDDLLDDTSSLFTTMLLPEIVNTPFAWQHGYQADNVAPVPGIVVEN